MDSQAEPVAIVGMDGPVVSVILQDSGSFSRTSVVATEILATIAFHRMASSTPTQTTWVPLPPKAASSSPRTLASLITLFFGMQQTEVETMDPSQRKLLEVTYEALENAGETLDSVSGTRTGVFVGNFTVDHTVIHSRDPEYPRPYVTTGTSLSLLSNRISYIFNLQGPSVTLDTACSSSMYALHMAVNAIRNGDCDSAVVAASNWIIDPTMQIMMNKLGALSSTSRCHTFDISADGYARGEGFAAIYLCKISTALDHGNPIRAVVRGTAINANGRTGGITHPSKSGQETVIRQAYRNAGNLPLADTTYCECHGTGTPVGDPIEIEAIGNVFSSLKSSREPLYVGSIKTNLGHTESASAIAGIMKVVLALESGFIPPSIGIETLNPRVGFREANVKVLTDLTPWPEGKLRRASINSFGYGGANGHCIIDHVRNVLHGYVKPGLNTPITYNPFNAINGHTNHDANRYTNGHTNGHANGEANDFTHSSAIDIDAHVPAMWHLNKIHRADAGTRRLVLLPFSAHNEGSLKLNVAAMADALTTKKHSLADVAYTLSARRTKLMQRSFRIVESKDVARGMAVEQPISSSSAATITAAFVFTGQGAQWNGMGKHLFEYGVFSDTIDYLDRVIEKVSVNTPVTWTIKDVLRGVADDNLVNVPEVSQTVCTALQIGIVDLLASWSIRPTAVTGHSSGEMAAAYAAGRLTAAESIVAAFFRGQAVKTNTQNGAMLAVGMGLRELDESDYLQGFEESIAVAAINSPASLTLSGDVEAIGNLAAKLTAASVFNRILRTGGNAYHSHHMATIGKKYQEWLGRGMVKAAAEGFGEPVHRNDAVPWVSSVFPMKDTTTMPVDATYWRANLESPVRFSEAVQQLVKTVHVNAMIEIGPHGALRGPVDQSLKEAEFSAPVMASLERNKDGQACLLKLAGNLFAMNFPVDLPAVNAVDELEGYGTVQGCMAVDLPPYQYAYGPILYHESRLSKEYRGRSIIRHDLVGSKLPGNAKFRPQWRNILRVRDLPWLAEHRLVPDAVFPAAGYVAMAVEVAARAHGDNEGASPITGFNLRNVEIKSALRIPEDDYGVEVIVTLELEDAARAKAPAWVPFSISSVSSTTDAWTEHCAGYVRVQVSPTQSNLEKMNCTMDARLLDSKALYRKFEQLGLGYGDAFQGLSNIEADPTQNMASASLNLKTTRPADKCLEKASRHPIHPASLDALFQLGLVSCHGGQLERTKNAFVPIHISQIYIKNGNDEAVGTALAKGELRGLRGAYAKLQVLDKTGSIVVDIPKLRCITYGEASAQDGMTIRPFESQSTRLTWLPDFRTLNCKAARQLFPPPQENVDREPLSKTVYAIAALIVVEVHEKYNGRADLADAPEQIRLFLAWIRRRVELDETEVMKQARGLDAKDRQELLESLCAGTEDVIEVKIARRLLNNMDDILYGRTTGVEVLVQDGHLTTLYDTGVAMTGAYPQLQRVIDGLGHANPHQKILEIGAGTGGATRIAMATLHEEVTQIKRYDSYTFTDVSPGFLAAASEFMAPYRDIEYAVLDIDQDPEQQGQKAEYDVVLASQCLHATAHIDGTLKHCSKLLKPGGKLILVENTGDSFVHGLILGTLTGYWDGIPDGRVESPFLDLPSWEKALKGAGFSGVDFILDDYPHPYSTASTMLATLSPPKSTKSVSDNRVTNLLYSDGIGKDSPLVSHVADEMTRNGVSYKFIHIDTAMDLGPNSRIVAFLDDKNLLLTCDAKRLALFQHLAASAATMVWVTSGGIMTGANADAALLAGLLRTVGTENPTAKFLFFDIASQDVDAEEWDEIASWMATKELNLQQTASEQDAFEDREFSWQNGCGWVSRLLPDDQLAEQQRLGAFPASTAEMLPIDSQGPVRAAFETPGILTSLYFRPYTELLRALPHDYIEVKVAAVGLNWKDLGIAAGTFDANNLSAEYSGIITKVGSSVKGFAVGETVYGMGHGHLGNYTQVPACFAAKLQPTDDLVAVATMPLVCMTAVYAFDHVTTLKAGEKLLIQSATGGLGLAAIQLAKAKGADVYATVGGEEKKRFLIEKVGLPASHIFSSRDVTDLQRAMREGSDGRGFDVVLSAVRGEDMLYETFKVLAPLGRLIDVGRIDVMDGNRLGLELFQKSITFASFDLGLILENSPEVASKLMAAVHAYYRAGDIGPIRPHAVSTVDQLPQVLLNFSKGTHVGKHVISFQDPEALVRMVPSSDKTAKFDPEAQYVIAGGLGALGRSIIRWMADRGACHVAVLSRSGAGTPEANSLIQDMATRGVEVQPIICDMTAAGKVNETIGDLAKIRTIRGVVHAAMFLQDISFAKLTIDQWNNGIAAKVFGTKNLHNATLGMPLDFFVMTTSLESIVALATQSAYTAANNFQEAFARQRRRQGLPASTASFGLITDAGHLSREATAVNMMSRNKAEGVTEHEFLRLIEPAFVDSFSNDGTRHDPLASVSFTTCLDAAAMAERKLREPEETTVPRWYSDGRVSLLMRAMNDACRHGKNAQKDQENGGGSRSSAMAKLRDNFDEAIRAGAGAEARDKSLTLVCDAIIGAMAAMLSISPASISLSKGVADYGVDSLIAAELRNWFSQAFRANISLLDLLDAHTSIRQLAIIVVDGALAKESE
ncbi:Acyl transferase/acyl hydrolase/lysophospholipase [Penicillium italicum]|uniref:Acyl transferase/acyl hydrolase/lysophospholipase n=1 Tax=Penicillium italicum TaxID=40296 RepID=A0A0A2L8D9_PENIT|nr:Acyl transferase/acyl hydrolase/lysophospholipase [Penicillium italicum]